MSEHDPAVEPTRRSDEGHWARPVRTLTAKEVPSGALDLNVSGRRVHAANAGFGRLWQKSFWAVLDGAAVTPRDVVRVWKERFADFWPKGNRMFLPAVGVAPGEVGVINASLLPGVPRVATGVLVMYADDVSFSFLSPVGHPFAGPITFSATEDAGVTVVRVDELTRASDPLYELAMLTPFLGDRMQNRMWRETLRNVAGNWGVDAVVHEHVVCVDHRPQWSQAKNIFYNAALRSALYAFVRPFMRR